ncbi:MAG: chorismate pyruvate-lyase family protein [Candidatus Hydrothermarchaeota archaeon]|jgi:chorismate-pyruvate lyase|nr:chorismate pyruvate-lyase family protein [Candidatus Hydrothermarchaeota archaeon]
MMSLSKIEEKLILSSVQKILLATDGSITRILEAIRGGSIIVETITQELINADMETSDILDIDLGSTVNYRVVNLRDSKKVLIRAVSYAPVERLPQEFREDIMKKDKPIGRIMAKLRIEARREIKGFKIIKADEELSGIFEIPLGALLLKRMYNIIYQGEVLLNITEIFPHAFFRG